MAYILALDTTGRTGSIALAEGGRLIDEVVVEAPDGFSHLLFFEIGQLLAKHGQLLRDVACFAAAAGPGSFTGVRVGLTAAMGLAEAAGAKVVAVSYLQALAWSGAGELRAPYLDARRGDIFGAVYDAQLRLVREETVAKYEEWAGSLPEGVRPLSQQGPLARAVAAIAWDRFAAGLAQDPGEVEANYVRRSDAEMMWREL